MEPLDRMGKYGRLTRDKPDQTMAKNRKRVPKCSLLKAVNDRFAECAHEYSSATGKPSDYKRYMQIGTLIQRRVNQRLRDVFIWEDRKFVDFDPYVYYQSNLLVQIEARKLQKLAHDYRRMLVHMRDNGLVSMSEKYCHDENGYRFCKSYTVNTNLLRSAIDTKFRIELESVEIPKTDMEELEELAAEAKKTEWVEYSGIRMRFDIDGLLQEVSDDFTQKQKDRKCVTFSKARCALHAWIDRKRGHGDHVVDYRNFHFLTSMPKAALAHVYDDKGNRFHEIVDLPSGNILTTALSMYNGNEIPKEEYMGILKGIFKKEECGSTYDQFISETKCKFPRVFVKKCFQTFINCSDRQMKRHEGKAKWYCNHRDNEHFRISKCVVDIYNWLKVKYPNFGSKLRTYKTVPSSRWLNEEVKATYYAFTYIEKNLIERIQEKLKPVKTIRIHDAVWGFEGTENLKEKANMELKRAVREFSTTNRISYDQSNLEEIFSNKVRKAVKRKRRKRAGKVHLVTKEGVLRR